MKKYIKILTLFFTLSFLWGCLEDPEVYKVTVKTNSTVEFVQGGVALSGGIYTENVNYQPTIDSCGFCYAITEEPTLSNSVVKVKTPGIGDFNATLKSLHDGTKYYVRAFAQNKYGVVYGEEVSFVSLTKPTVKTLSLSEDNENSQLIVECELESLGSGEITELGVCYSSENKLPNKENDEYKLVSNIQKGKYTISITVKPNTKYYVRAFASNLASVAYGNVKESKYIISFNSNGGNGEMNEMIVSPSRNIQLPLNSFTRVGYVFIGWNTKADASGLTYSDNQMVSISENIILYAQWREDYVDLGLSSGTLWAKMNIGASAPEEYGDYFAWGEIETKSLFRWSTYRWCNGGDYEHNLTKYCMQEYEGIVDNKIILELADDAAHANWGGNWRMPSKAELEELCTECIWTETTINAINGYLVVSKTNDNSIFLPSAGYYDYISDYLKNEGSCGLYWSSSLRTDVSDYAFFMSTANHVISAQERYSGRTVRPVLSANNIEKPELPAKYTITFYTNGGVGNLFSKSIGVGSFITLPTNKFTRTGYEFVGWNTSSDGTGISYTEGQTITPRGNISLYAQWKKKEYTITFNSNGGSGSMSSKTVSAGSTVSLSANSFIRSGYEFDGWNISSDGTGTSYTDGQIITPTGNITLYAQWKKKEVYYTITFNANGGSGTMSSKTVSTGFSVTLSNSTFTRSGYEFVGWNTNSNGAGISYSNGQTITPSGDMTLYAQWKKVESTDIDIVSGYHNGHEYVDLGLPSGTLWATCNVGASKPEEYGDYFAWGETQPKVTYNWSTYKWCNGSETTLTKYCTTSTYGNVDNKIVLDLSDEVANVNWGGNWVMPTYEELYELLSECIWKWSNKNGVNGYLVTGPRGNSIFLPAAGSYRDSNINNVDSYGAYWSGSLDASESFGAYGLSFVSDDVYGISGNRKSGLTVRPVIKSSYNVTFDSNGGEGSMQSIVIEEIKQIVIPSNKFTRVGYYFDGWNTKADGSGMSYKENEVITITNNFTLYPIWKSIQTTGYENGHEWVDLGLPSGTLWATCNVGASKPEYYGDYFAWGETSIKSSYTSSNYIYLGDPTVLPLNKDAANVNWGGKWRMPTKAECQELLDICLWSWEEKNGVEGYCVTSKANNKSIFLPALDANVVGYDYRKGGYYWSSSLYPYVHYPSYNKFTDEANFLLIQSDYRNVSSRKRYWGLSVRPVMSK